jgi:hypothetical protein
MLSAEQLSKQIEALADQRVSVNDFEDWFRDESRDVHLWGDQNLNELVEAVEALFSERYFGGLDEKRLRQQLQEEARRFARPFVLRGERLRAIVVRDASFSPALATAAVAVLLLVPAPVPQLLQLEERDVARTVDGRALDGGTSCATVLEPQVVPVPVEV